MLKRIFILLALLSMPLLATSHDSAWPDVSGGTCTEVNDAEVDGMANIQEHEGVFGTGVGTAGYAAYSDCDGAGEAVTYDETTHAPGCNTSLMESWSAQARNDGFSIGDVMVQSDGGTLDVDCALPLVCDGTEGGVTDTLDIGFSWADIANPWDIGVSAGNALLNMNVYDSSNDFVRLQFKATTTDADIAIIQAITTGGATPSTYAYIGGEGALFGDHTFSVGGGTDYWEMDPADNTFKPFGTAGIMKAVVSSASGSLQMNAITLATAGAVDQDVPDATCAAAADIGNWFTVVVEDASKVVSIQPLDVSNTLIVEGLAQSAGDEVDSCASGTENEGCSITFTCLAAEQWYSTARVGTWQAGGAAD